MIKVRKLKRLLCGLIAVPLVIACYNQVSTYAFDGPTITSARKYFKGCKAANRFDDVDENLYVKGSNFPSNTDVDIYVTSNRRWRFGDIIGFYLVNGPEPATTNSIGKLKCTKIWENPLVPGKYDIVVDTNQDGTFNEGDAVDAIGSSQGFKVVD